jgi:predicted nuclease of predicted toxin-antitoxin system
MKVLCDMNLNPQWAAKLAARGRPAIHWPHVGAGDATVMTWARCNGDVVLTHDLDLSALLAAAATNGPSVAQLRARDVQEAAMTRAVTAVFRSHAPAPAAGAIVTMDDGSHRVRTLSLRRG